jgi:acetyl-CoA carboxylase biotin carboxyl carrier protein
MDLDKIKTLIDFVGQSRVSELSVSEHGTTIRLVHFSPQHEAADAMTPHVIEGSDTGAYTVSAPAFGIFHRASSPSAKPFVSIGDQIEIGQSLFIIEAMKVFNTITAERGGRVVGIVAQDGQEVDAGQPLLEIA